MLVASVCMRSVISRICCATASAPAVAGLTAAPPPGLPVLDGPGLLPARPRQRRGVLLRDGRRRAIDGRGQRAGVAREVLQHVQPVVEREHRHPLPGRERLLQVVLRRLLRQLAGVLAEVVEHQGHERDAPQRIGLDDARAGRGQAGVGGPALDQPERLHLARRAVLEDRDLVLPQIADRTSALVAHDDVEQHRRRAGAEDGRGVC